MTSRRVARRVVERVVVPLNAPDLSAQGALGGGYLLDTSVISEIAPGRQTQLTQAVTDWFTAHDGQLSLRQLCHGNGGHEELPVMAVNQSVTD